MRRSSDRKFDVIGIGVTVQNLFLRFLKMIFKIFCVLRLVGPSRLSELKFAVPEQSWLINRRAYFEDVVENKAR